MSVSYEQWHQRVEDTLRWRKQYWNGSEAWKRYLALYRGDHWRSTILRHLYTEPDSEKPRDRITVQRTLSTVLTMVPFLMKQDPKFALRARRYDSYMDVLSAFLQQEILNYEWRERGMQKQAKESILDLAIIGHGVLKTGFTYEAPLADNPKKQGEVDFREYIKADTPYLQRVRPLHFIFDVDIDTCDLESSKWCGHIFFRSKEDIISDSSYSKKVRQQIYDNVETVNEIHPLLYKNQEEQETNKRCILYEIWDKKYSNYYVFISGIKEPLIEMKTPYDYLEGYPFVKMDYISIPDEPYGVGIPYVMEDQQLELNRVRTTMFEHRRRFNRKYGVVENEIDPSEKTKFEQGKDGTVVWVKSQNAIFPIQDANLTSDNYKLEAIINNDIDDVTGIDSLIRGGSLPSRTSAAEINTRQGNFTFKVDARVEVVDEGIKMCGRKLLQHIKSNYTREQLVPVVGPLGEYWIKYTPEDIQAEVEFDMETVSAPRIDPMLERQQAIELLNVLTPHIQSMTQLGVLDQNKLKQIYDDSIRKILGENRNVGSFGLGNVANVQPGTTTNIQQLSQGSLGGLSSGNLSGSNGGSKLVS